MKQKNLILVAVAVGCGLVAAFLTTQLSAGQKKQDDGVEIPVAAKDLPVGTKLNKDDLKTLITYKKFSKDSLPSAYAGTEEELVDKRLMRTIRVGEPINPKDLTTNSPISPPPGFNVITFGATPEKGVAGFAGPGSRVDVIASVMMRKQQKAVVFPLLIDMLVLAIDTKTQYDSNGAFPNLSMVSMAVNNKHAMLLHGAINRGADLRLVLRNTEKAPIWDKIPTDEEIWKILADEGGKSGRSGGEGGSNADDPDEEPKANAPEKTVKLPVPTADLPAGTRLTQDVIDTKFKLVDYTPPAPAAFVQNLHEHVGKFLQKDLTAEQFVPKTAFGDTKPEAPKTKPTAPGTELTPAPAPVYHDTTVQTSEGVRTYRYEVLKDGKFKFLGEVKGDGTLRPAKPGQAGPDDKAAPQDDKKADRVIRA